MREETSDSVLRLGVTLFFIVFLATVGNIQIQIDKVRHFQTCIANGGVYHSFIDSSPTCEKLSGDLYKDVGGQWELVGDNTVILK